MLGLKTVQIGRELRVRYGSKGASSGSGKQVRITAELIDAESDAHLWAQRFDRDIGDLFSLQNEITRQIATARSIIGLSSAVSSNASFSAIRYIDSAGCSASEGCARTVRY